VRPVHALTLAVRPAHQPPHGNAERLAREIPQRQLDTGDGLLRGAVRRLADRAVQIEVVLLDRGGVLADEARAEILDEPDQPAREALAAELAVAGEALVGADGAEVPGAMRLEPGVDDERLDRGDLHGGIIARRPAGRNARAFEDQ
jgi:hypothetical protein